MLARALLLLGLLIVPTLWLIAALATNSRAGWMALAVAANAVALVRMGRFPGGATRGLSALLTAATGIVASGWLISAMPIGAAMGQLPFTAARHMGADFAWTLASLGSTPMDWTWTAAALLLAGWRGR
jgi:hypothetical protein